jgi:SNF2 family DNA or RNA helicase
MDAIEKGVNEVGKKGSRLGYMRIDGKTPAKQRDANVTRFQEDHSCKVTTCWWSSCAACQSATLC